MSTDYIQIEFGDWRLQAKELGIHTIELQNLRRLTPSVFRANQNPDGPVAYDASFGASNSMESNAGYCLDRSVSIMLKKHQHAQGRREPVTDAVFDPPQIYVGHTLHECPAADSPAVHTVQEGFARSICRIVWRLQSRRVGNEPTGYAR